jgi:hypothetical protein
MIHFVVGAEGSFSIRYYLEEEGSALRDTMRVVLYDDLARLDRLPLGTWVFTEIDRLSEAERDMVTVACEGLAPAKDAARVMNQPRRMLLRHDLLRAAHDAGMNRFRSWLATEVVFGHGRRAAGKDGSVAASALRYPVFVRFVNRHTGNLTPLLDSPRQLEAAIASLMSARHRLDDLLVVEFCDTKDEHGVYRKYSAYKIGDRVLPRYLECSRDWMVKWDWRIFDRVRADEETRYLETNPHESWIRQISPGSTTDASTTAFSTVIRRRGRSTRTPRSAAAPVRESRTGRTSPRTRKCSPPPSARSMRSLKTRGAPWIPPTPPAVSSSPFPADFDGRSRPKPGGAGKRSSSARLSE